jgi:hypothetical protein
MNALLVELQTKTLATPFFLSHLPFNALVQHLQTALKRTLSTPIQSIPPHEYINLIYGEEYGFKRVE